MDFDAVFVRGDGNQTTNIYADTGIDIGRRYLAGDSGRTVGWRNKDGKDVGRIFGADDLVIQRLVSGGSYGWYSSVSGQSNTGGADTAGFDLLDSYDLNIDKFVNVMNVSERIGHDIAYRSTAYTAFRIYCAYENSDVNIDIKYTLIDGGNGAVTISEIREHSIWHKDFVLRGHGGDKGHYGQANVDITLFAGALGTYTYHGEWWINSD